MKKIKITLLKLCFFLSEQRRLGKAIYPVSEDIFRAFALTSLDQLKLVIIGQDPYHGSGQAHGLSFSVPDNVKLHINLKIFIKEISSDCNVEMPIHGNLTKWAEQGVLLLNSVLSVEAGKPGSHSKIGWQTFTDHVIRSISSTKCHVVFLLWGAYAQSKQPLICSKKHLILSAAHPSPFSVHRGFFLAVGIFHKLIRIYKSMVLSQ